MAKAISSLLMGQVDRLMLMTPRLLSQDKSCCNCWSGKTKPVAMAWAPMNTSELAKRVRKQWCITVLANLKWSYVRMIIAAQRDKTEAAWVQ